jgi:hypothetical protein
MKSDHGSVTFISDQRTRHRKTSNSGRSTTSGVEEFQYLYIKLNHAGITIRPISDPEGLPLSNCKKANDAGVKTVYIAEEIGAWK